MCAAQVEPEHEYDYRDEGDYIPEYTDYDQDLCEALLCGVTVVAFGVP